MYKDTGKNKMRNVPVRMVAVVSLMVMLLSLAACSITNSLVGEYNGTGGSYLKLNKDGTCIYAEIDATGTGTGTWRVEDDVIYIDVSNIPYVVYGNVADFDGDILLEATAGSWKDEYFQKAD